MIRINVSRSPSATLPAVYGFPVKLLMPTRLGFKNPRHIVAMEVTNTYPGGSPGGLRLQLVQRHQRHRHVATATALTPVRDAHGDRIDALRPRRHGGNSDGKGIRAALGRGHPHEVDHA